MEMSRLHRRRDRVAQRTRNLWIQNPVSPPKGLKGLAWKGSTAGEGAVLDHFCCPSNASRGASNVVWSQAIFVWKGMKKACLKVGEILSWFPKTTLVEGEVAPRNENSDRRFPMAAAAAALRLCPGLLDNWVPEHLTLGTVAVFRDGPSGAASAHREDTIVEVGVGDD